MGTTATIWSFIKALPELVKIAKEMVAAVTKLQDAVTEKAIEGLKTDVNLQITRLKGAKTNEERAKIIADLNAKLGM